MITKVVGIDAINHGRPTGCRRNRRQQAVQLPLAGVTALLGIAGIGRILELGRGDLPMLQPQPGRLGRGLGPQMGSQGGGHAGDRQRRIAALLHGQSRHQRAVNAAGVSHHHLIEGRQLLAQGSQGCVQRGRQRFEQGEVHQAPNPDPILATPTQRRR